MHDHLRDTLERLTRVRRDRIAPQIHHRVADVDVSSWLVADDGEPVSARHALGLGDDEGRAPASYSPFEGGSPWGQAWATRWFHVEGRIPADVSGEVELLFDLGWFDHSVGGHAEALVHSRDGVPVKGLHPKQRWVRVRGTNTHPAIASNGDDGSIDLYIEAAANPLLLGLPPFVVTEHGEKGAPDFEEFILRTAELAVFRPEVYEFAVDLDVCGELVKTLTPDSPRYWRLLRGIEEALDIYDERDAVASAVLARAVLTPLLAQPAHASTLEVTAVGHAHMDSAWLWPLRETVRKLGRTVSNALALLDSDPTLIYTMTSAQHFHWLETHYPDLFERVSRYVAEGRFVPVGGMWVEVDGLIPAGESFVRQIVLGKAYFADRFGLDSREVWLPDSFGYSGALPQIARRSGSDVFLTQKISWNDTTVFPHHSFWWEGIDGTRVFTHFPPADTYAASVTADELAHTVSNFKDKAIATHALLAYGYGDGGGGPTREMASRLQRFADLEGAPRVTSRSPEDFFRDAEQELRDLPSTSAISPVWHGELYLELHRGSLTSQQAMKRGNRRSEALLREVEHASAAAAIFTGAAYPAAELQEIWQGVLLHQFHDILPGTSIAWVHREARDFYAETEARLDELLNRATSRLQDAGALVPASESLATPTEVTAVDGDADAERIVLDNGILRVVFDETGHATSLRTSNGTEYVTRGARLNEFVLFRDEPVRWDAWDLDRHVLRHPRPVHDLSEIEVVHDGDDAGVRVVRSFGASRLTATTWLRAGAEQLETEAEIDWREREQLLKVAVPFAIRGRTASFEAQYGNSERPLHVNDAGDEAMFEGALQRYVHVAEGGRGAAVLASTIAGADARTDDSGIGTTVRLSLLRGARFPDPDADLGIHRFAWAVRPDASLPDAVEAARDFARPESAHPGLPALASLDMLHGHAVIDWIKLAEDGSGDVIVRLYETQGARASARLAVHPALGDGTVTETDLLEHAAPADGPRLALQTDADGTTSTTAADALLDLAPYQLCTLRLTPAR
nr:glycoside hydrolase family 38 C-terminal domain-containing protein [Microbacterium hydrocarbonoxydans]